MYLTVTISGDFHWDDELLDEFKEDLEEECRFLGGKGVVIEVQRG